MKNALYIFVLGLLMTWGVANAKNRPNVILIVTDDQGYGDLSCHGNPVIKTPNIDRLYRESVRFTDFHVDPTCAPTRAALMSGKYSHRAGVWHTISGGNHLRASETTMADIFKASGYRTGLFGKWHLGSNYPYRPMDRGFDEWLGQGDGGTVTTEDWFFNDRVNDMYWHNGEREYREGYSPDVFFNSAIDFIQESDQPFFTYIATYLPHDPHTIPDTAMIAKYKGQISNYVAHFFAGIDRIDQNIGKLRQVLEESGKADNTILMFMSDNGGTGGVKLYNAGMRGRKGMPYEGGHRVPFFIHWTDGKLKQGTDVEDLTAHFDILPTLIDLCDLKTKKGLDLDGRSFKAQLYNPKLKLEERTLFVETQRTMKPQAWYWTAGMTNRWRMVNNKELYDIQQDPGQKYNVIDDHPEVVKKIRQEYETYWARVSPHDREKPRIIVGDKKDQETYLSSSDWYTETTPWNHAIVARGEAKSGAWEIAITQSGTYHFEVSRWPREANAPIQGVPVFEKKLDAWLSSGPVDHLIYGKEINALNVDAISLTVGDYSTTKKVKAEDTHLSFDLKLKKGDTTVESLMLNAAKEVIAGTYYVYISKVK